MLDRRKLNFNLTRNMHYKQFKAERETSVQNSSSQVESKAIQFYTNSSVYF